MKTKLTVVGIMAILVSYSFTSTISEKKKNSITEKTTQMPDSVLRHVVLFKFKDGTAKEDIKKVEDAFSALPAKIPEIMGYEWGTNNSPEGLDKGFTHSFFLTFKSEEDRAIYLPHPDHKAFGAVLTPYLDDVLVIDYWTR
ncbi:Dabb family protein [Maribacter aestuarii]|uniref:Dabb family protein n=1 Tax=Maribacter aestuarii TaxID=1130723 RepID=UPI0025A513ED|nr:Dabb family protein [Maribacter aestuarii]